MADRSPKDLDSEEVYKAWERNGRNFRATARALGVHPTAVSAHVNRIRDAPVAKLSLDKQVRLLKAQLGEAEEKLRVEARLRDEVLTSKGIKTKEPGWAVRKPSKKDIGHMTGVPTLFMSDWHWGEIVRGAEVGMVNEYNLTIAQRRLRNLVETTIDLLKNHVANAKYPGLVIAMGGDMLSGDIHDELRETNEISSLPTLLDLLGSSAWAIKRLKEAFGQLFIVGVTGNHGRTTARYRYKQRAHTNLDWLFYQLLARYFEGDSAICFQIPEGPDAYYKVYGHRYMLTHGDQFRGGDGMIGMLGPVIRGDHKKRTRAQQVDQGYDTLLLGHWHQLHQLRRAVINGSLKGYDEYAYGNNFPYEPPAQALWITHPEYGITFKFDVYVDRVDFKEAKGTEWISMPVSNGVVKSKL